MPASRLPPQQCELCRAWARQPLCPQCIDRFARPQPRCPRCALRSADGQACGECLRQPPPFDRALAAVDYDFPWDRLIVHLKFQSQPELARCLAPLLADTVEAAVALNNLTLPELLLPVPLSPQRLRERGYNQAWVIAQALARQLSLAATATALVRSRDTPHQVGLTRSAREANLRDGLWVDPAFKVLIDGRRVALIDDVMTTGATAHAAAQALRLAGAAEVQVWVLARTPREA